ncbi:hypothetical protein RYX36_035844, partial [Vicia faba]
QLLPQIRTRTPIRESAIELTLRNPCFTHRTPSTFHRFSEETKPVRVQTGDWPDRRSMQYYQRLLRNDFQLLPQIRTRTPIRESAIELTLRNPCFTHRTPSTFHRFSEETKPVRVQTGDWPDRRSMQYYQRLLRNDFQNDVVWKRLGLVTLHVD